MALLLYLIVAVALLWIAHRWITPVSRAAAIVLLLIPCVFTGEALVTSRVYGPVDRPFATQPLHGLMKEYGLETLHNAALSDLYGQMIPWRQAVRWSIARGEWPLWNPFMLSGDILAASGQPAPYSPWTLLALLLPVPLSLTFSATLTHFLAALCAYLFARELGCRDAAALTAAAGWSCATALSFFILWPLGVAWSMFPLVLLGIRRGSYPLLTIAFVLLLLAGHPETALHVVFLGGFYALLRRSGRLVLTCIAAGVTSLALTAIFLLPMLEAAPQTMEHQTRTELFAKTSRGLPNEQVMARLAIDLFPYLHGRTWTFGQAPFDASSAGSIILALAIFAMWRVRGAERWFFSGVAVFGLLAHAEWSPLARALQQLPLLDVALNERFSFAAAFALVVLAALGVEELLRDHAVRGALFTLVGVLVLLAAGHALLVRAALGVGEPVAWGRHAIAAELIGLAVATIAVWRRSVPLLFAALLVQRVLVVGDIYESFPQRVAYPPVPILETLRDVPRPFRITGHGNALLPATATMYGLEDVRGYQAMSFRRYHETFAAWSIHQPVWYNRVDDLTRPFLSFLNVRYAITWDRDPPPDGWFIAAHQPGSYLFENLNVIERVFVPRQVRIGLPVHETLAQMREESDFRERAWIGADVTPYERQNGPGRVTFHTGPRQFVIDAEMEGDGWIVVSVPRWEGWRARVDGRSTKVQFANHAFTGVHVPAGRHRIELEYLPQGFVAGRRITLVTALLLAAFGVVRAVRRRRRSSITSSLRDAPRAL